MARTLRFGLQQGIGGDFAGTLRRVERAEAGGYSVYLVPDHFYTGSSAAGSSAAGGDEARAEAWTSIAAIGARTERIRVGGAVMCNLFRHPCLTAQTAATVDVVTGGRLELGIGAGWLEEEFRRTGLDYPKPSVRIRMLDEALKIIVPSLRGETVDFDGEFYTVRDFEVRPTAVQRPMPVHIGGGGDKILTLAARWADTVSLVPPLVLGRIDPRSIVTFDAARFRERVGFLRNAAEQAGRDPASIEVGSMVFVLQPTESAAETAKVAQGLAGMFGVEEKVIRESPLALVGTPQEMVAALQERRERHELGLVITPGPSEEVIERFAREVIQKL